LRVYVPRPAIAPTNETEKARLNLLMPGRTKQLLMDLQRETGSASIADLIAKAVALYELVIRETRDPPRELVVIDREEYDQRPVGRRITVL
jgi:hypothetical protein